MNKPKIYVLKNARNHKYWHAFYGRWIADIWEADFYTAKDISYYTKENEMKGYERFVEVTLKEVK